MDLFIFFCHFQTPASSRTASFSENRARVEGSPAKKAKNGAPISENTHTNTNTHTHTELGNLCTPNAEALMRSYAWVHCWAACSVEALWSCMCEFRYKSSPFGKQQDSAFQSHYNGSSVYWYGKTHNTIHPSQRSTCLYCFFVVKIKKK